MIEPHEELVVEIEEGLAVLRLNRPERLNALSPGLLARLQGEVPGIVASPKVRAVMITGSGRGFCAGGDVGAMDGPADAEAILAGMRANHGWLLALRGADKPVIAAVNGVAAGGGFGLAMIADVVVASDAAVFKTAFGQLGVAADFGLAFTLPRAVGSVRAAELLFSDQKLSASQALEIGLVSQVLPAETFEREARAVARRLARASRGLQLTKGLVRFEEIEAFARFLEIEAERQVEAFQSEDFGEGVAAFRERRPPKFSGR